MVELSLLVTLLHCKKAAIRNQRGFCGLKKVSIFETRWFGNTPFLFSVLDMVLDSFREEAIQLINKK
jgi:hypothetical protein